MAKKDDIFIEYVVNAVSMCASQENEVCKMLQCFLELSECEKEKRNLSSVIMKINQIYKGYMKPLKEWPIPYKKDYNFRPQWYNEFIYNEIYQQIDWNTIKME